MEKLFQLKQRGTTAKREFLAGFTTFLTMAYILAVNPAILGVIGGNMTPGAVFTATAIASGVATLMMAFTANLPVALAPGMGINAFFTYTVVIGMGFSWQLALTAVFLEGIVFFILSLFNIRMLIIKAIPENVNKAIVVGIGLFIALVGFANAGIIVHGAGTLLEFGDMSQPSVLLALLGFVLIIVLHTLKAPGAILIGILGTTIISIIAGVTVIPSGWMPLSLPAAPLFFQFELSSDILTLKFFSVFFTLLIVNIFDSFGTLLGVSAQAGLRDNDGNIPRIKQALLSNAVGTFVGAGLGTSTLICYVESSSGVAAGGRTGLTSVSTGMLFFLALLFSPVFLLIPGFATAPVLIFVGFLMMSQVIVIDFKDPAEGIPAFLTIVMMPFAYGIAHGIMYGILSYCVLKAVTGKWKDISLVTWILFVIFALRFFIQVR